MTTEIRNKIIAEMSKDYEFVKKRRQGAFVVKSQAEADKLADKIVAFIGKAPKYRAVWFNPDKPMLSGGQYAVEFYGTLFLKFDSKNSYSFYLDKEVA